MKIQLVIPMSGLGSRFVAQDYKDLKPLIKVHEHYIIEWVLRMFPGIEDPLFICRQSHLKTSPMRNILETAKPESQIVGIEGAKLGPVGALMKAFDQIDDTLPVLVSYCDFYMHWDFDAFKSYLEKGNFDGAVPCYTGFHPHLMPAKNLYASCRTNAVGELLEIREKHSFEADKTKAFHSPGVYYFKSGTLLKEYCKKLVSTGETLAGEYYVSLLYPQMIADGLRVGVPTNVKQFCQWGTPEDLQDYLYWSNVVQRERT